MPEMFTHYVDVLENNACFEGHFPTQPIFPAVAQLALLQQAITAYHQKECELIGLPVSKFLSPIVPNTSVMIELTLKDDSCMLFVVRSEQHTITKGRLRYRVVNEK